jgi:hypothetical protein
MYRHVCKWWAGNPKWTGLRVATAWALYLRRLSVAAWMNAFVICGRQNGAMQAKSMAIRVPSVDRLVPVVE